jgi:hypothetical protein
MGLIRLRLREFVGEKGWTLKDLADRSGVAYSSVRAYAFTNAPAPFGFNFGVRDGTGNRAGVSPQRAASPLRVIIIGLINL